MSGDVGDLLGRVVATGGIGFLGIVLGALLRSIPKWREAEIGGEAGLRADMVHRIDKLESQVLGLETENQRQREKYEAAMRIMSHKLANETASLDALLMLLEAAPGKLSEHVDRIKSMRAERARNVAIETAGLNAMTVSDGRIGG